MIKGWLIYNEKDQKRNQAYIDWFIEEAKKQDVQLTFISREKLKIGIMNDHYSISYDHKAIHLPDFAVVRTVEPFLNRHLELLGVKSFNSYEVSALCNHKMNTFYAMKSLQIPIMDTWTMKREQLSETPPESYPFVIKESTGRGGEQVHFIQSLKEWKEVYNTFTTEDLIIQSTQVQHGKDLRVFVIGKNIIKAVLRESKSGFRANYSMGGSASPYSLSKSEIALIERIIHAYDFDLVGIDFLIDKNGQLILNEIEDVVGSRILSLVSDINLLEKYISHIKKQLSK